MNLFKMDTLGEIIRQNREDKALPLRIVAAFLDIDQAILSKIERGQRKATREQVIMLAKYFDIEEDELLIAWLSDKIVCEISDERIAKEALKVAGQKVENLKSKNT